MTERQSQPPVGEGEQVHSVSFVYDETGASRSITVLHADLTAQERVELALRLLDALKDAVSDPSLIYPAQGVPNARAVRSLANTSTMLLKGQPDTRPDLLPDDGLLTRLEHDIRQMQEKHAVTGYDETREPPTWEKQRDDLQGCYAAGEEMLTLIDKIRRRSE